MQRPVRARRHARCAREARGGTGGLPGAALCAQDACAGDAAATAPGRVV